MLPSKPKDDCNLNKNLQAVHGSVGHNIRCGGGGDGTAAVVVPMMVFV